MTAVQAELLLQLILRRVNRVVQLKDVAVAGHLGVERDHKPPGAVVVDDEVVDVEHLGVGHDDIAYPLHQLRLGRAAQQGIEACRAPR